jgi:hypothetical protein
VLAFEPRFVGLLPPRRIQRPDGNAVDALLAKENLFLIQSPGDKVSSNGRQFPFGQSTIDLLLGQQHFTPVNHHAESYVGPDTDVTVNHQSAQQIRETLGHDLVAASLGLVWKEQPGQTFQVIGLATQALDPIDETEEHGFGIGVTFWKTKLLLGQPDQIKRDDVLRPQ